MNTSEMAAVLQARRILFMADTEDRSFIIFSRPIRQPSPTHPTTAKFSHEQLCRT